MPGMGGEQPERVPKLALGGVDRARQHVQVGRGVVERGQVGLGHRGQDMPTLRRGRVLGIPGIGPGRP